MLKNKNLIIVGTGETARLAYEYFTHDTQYNVIAFAVNERYIITKEYLSLPVLELETLESVYAVDEVECFVAMGSSHLNQDRTTVYNDVKTKGYTCTSYVSSKAFIWHDVKIGENCFILENNVLQSGVIIGNNVVLWSGNHVGHLAAVEDNVFISSHCVLSGSVKIESNSFLGVNCCIADGVTIAKDNFIGMGSVINKNTQEDGLYVGNPAERKSIGAKKFCKVKE